MHIAYWEESEQREVVAKKFVPNRRLWGESQLQENFAFFPLLSLGKAFPTLKLTHNFYSNMNIYFS